MSIGIEKVPMSIFFDLKSVRKSGEEWSCGEKAIGGCGGTSEEDL